MKEELVLTPYISSDNDDDDDDVGSGYCYSRIKKITAIAVMKK